MTWKDKLFTLINTRFYTKEEIDSKATVVFMRDKDFSLNYNGETFSSNRIQIDQSKGIYLYIVVMELLLGTYHFEQGSEYGLNIYQGEGDYFLEVNQKLIFTDAGNYFEPEVTTQQEI